MEMKGKGRGPHFMTGSRAEIGMGQREHPRKHFPWSYYGDKLSNAKRSTEHLTCEVVCSH